MQNRTKKRLGATGLILSAAGLLYSGSGLAMSDSQVRQYEQRLNRLDDDHLDSSVFYLADRFHDASRKYDSFARGLEVALISTVATGIYTTRQLK
ncbi:MAG: hypothetical protein HY518_03575, partial [Candidatus Aenigmarchaeota archaeon]|nr:hypothetical protein [Candidatus Aenigmarchaeota archaeon]